MRTQLSDSQASVQRLEGEHKRLTKLLGSARESGDQHKTESERLQGALDELKAKHETDVAQARKHAAGLQRDKTDLQQALDAARAEAARAAKRLPRFGSPLTPNGADASAVHTPYVPDEEDVFGAAGGASTRGRRGDQSGVFMPGEFGEFMPADSPDASPSRQFLAPNHPSNELEALQQRLAHAQRQISTLKSTLQREKEQKIEYRRKLESSPGFGVPEEEENWEDDVDENGQNAKPRRVTPYRSVRGRGGLRGRGRGGFSLSDRLAMAGQSPSSEWNGGDYDGASSTPPPVPPLPNHLRDGMHEEEEENMFDESGAEPGSPSPTVPPSNRTSVDGMDPAFANVLRRTGSITSGTIPQNGSPLRQSVLARSRGNTLQRRRGGAAYQEARPPSLVVGEPEALAMELGMGLAADESLYKHEDPVKPETKEFACQTEPEEDKSTAEDKTVVLSPTPERTPVAEMGIQVEPDLTSEPVTVKTETDVQTEPFPVVSRGEMGIQHDTFPRPASILVGAGACSMLRRQKLRTC